MGVLTLEPVDDQIHKRWSDDSWLIQSRGYLPYHIVDGQQRLTTIIILIQCLSEQLKAGGKLNYSSRDEIQSKYVFIHKEGSDGSYLFGYEKDNPSYEYLKTRILQRSSSKYSSGESTIYTKNLLTAKEFFQAKVAKLKHLELEILFSKITQSLLFNVFNIDSEVDVHVAFETMNNRGLPLSNLELLKNRLIYLTTRLPESMANVESLRRSINDSWKTVYHYLGRNPKFTLSDDYFLQIHFLLYFADRLLTEHAKLFEKTLHHADGLHKQFLLDETFTLRRLLTPQASERISSTSLYQYSINLKATVELYYHLNFPEDGPFEAEEKIWLSRLRRLLLATHSKDIFLILMLLYQQKTKEKVESRIETLKLLEEYFFAASMMSYRMRRKLLSLDFSSLVLKCASKKIAVRDVISNVDAELKALKGSPTYAESLLEGLAERGYYEWVDLKYFMYEYECHLKVKARRKSDKIDWDTFIEDNSEDHSSIEHVLPQTPADPYWKAQLAGYTATQVRKITHSIGNFVATSTPRNSSLRNKPFPEKANSPDRKICYKFGSYSEIEIALNKDWGPEQVLKRGLHLLDFLSERWNVRLPNEKVRKKLLGLDFMAKD